MKRVFLILAICFSIMQISATEYSDFAAKEYAQRCNKENVRITVKKEHIEEYAQEVGNTFIPYITYGYGDLKAKKCHKQRITYLCLLDKDCNPLWSHIFPSK